jgi:hypothetical protein
MTVRRREAALDSVALAPAGRGANGRIAKERRQIYEERGKEGRKEREGGTEKGGKKGEVRVVVAVSRRNCCASRRPHLRCEGCCTKRSSVSDRIARGRETRRKTHPAPVKRSRRHWRKRVNDRLQPIVFVFRSSPRALHRAPRPLDTSPAASPSEFPLAVLVVFRRE